MPWRGYFHQIARVDVFVFYDCVQYDRRGWRNRNFIKGPHGRQRVTVPVNASGSHAGLRVCDVRIAEDSRWRRKMLASFETAYCNAPYWDTHRELIERPLQAGRTLLADLNCESTVAIARALGIRDVTYLRSSALGAAGRRTERLLDLLGKVGATHYLSGPSAASYLDEEMVREAGITLEYMRYEYPPYPQLHGGFDPGLSVLDLLFNTGPDAGRYIWGSEPRTA